MEWQQWVWWPTGCRVSVHTTHELFTEKTKREEKKKREKDKRNISTGRSMQKACFGTFLQGSSATRFRGKPAKALATTMIFHALKKRLRVKNLQAWLLPLHALQQHACQLHEHLVALASLLLSLLQTCACQWGHKYCWTGWAGGTIQSFCQPGPVTLLALLPWA